MRKIRKINVALISFAITCPAYANALFTLTPDRSRAQVSSQADAPFQVIWTVKNRLSVATAITLVDFGPDANGQAFTVINSSCDQAIAPGGTCTITTGITGSRLQANQSILSPKVCGLQGQACSQPIANNRVVVLKNNDPAPLGQWSLQAGVDPLSLPEFVSIHYPRLAIGLINQHYLPSIIECPNLYSSEQCRLLSNGLSGQQLNTVNALHYTANGDLIGAFIQTQANASNPATSYLMQLTNSSNFWTLFAPAYAGETLGLDPFSTTGLLSCAELRHSNLALDYVGLGLAKQFNASNNQVSSQNNILASGFNSIVEDGSGSVFVAGPQANESSPDTQLASRIWIWDPSVSNPVNAFTPLSMPDDILIITNMVSDGKGSIYIAGLDKHTDGHVWSYSTKTGLFTDTGLQASTVSALTFSPYGYVLAGGITPDTYVGAIWYYANSVWTNMNVPDSTKITSIAADANNDIVATGIDNNNHANVWLYH